MTASIRTSRRSSPRIAVSPRQAILPPYYRGCRDRPGQHRRRLHPRHGFGRRRQLGRRQALAGFGTSPGTGYGNPLAALGPVRIDRHVPESDEHAARVRRIARSTAVRTVLLTPDVDNIGLTGNFRFKLTDNGPALRRRALEREHGDDEDPGEPGSTQLSIRPTSSSSNKGIDPALLIFPSNPNYATAADYLQLRRRAGRRRASSASRWPSRRGSSISARVPRRTRRTRHRFTVGARGNWMKQDWELAYLYNKNKLAGSVTDGYFSLTEYAKIVQTSNDWNPWSTQQTAGFQGQAGPAAKYVGPTLNANVGHPTLSTSSSAAT